MATKSVSETMEASVRSKAHNTLTFQPAVYSALTEVFSPEKFHSAESSHLVTKENKQSILRQTKIAVAVSEARLFSDLSTDELQSSSCAGH